MKSIKIYLLPLFLLIFFSVQSFSQSGLSKDSLIEQQNFSKADSLLAESYMTERDYNEINDMKLYEEVYSEPYFGDEIYNEEPLPRSKRKHHFWDTAAADIVVEVAINAVFIIATFWQ